MTKTAKVFWSGRSQAVRLPKDFRIDAKEVRIRKQGHRIILEPVPQNWDWLDELCAMGPLDEDFLAALEEEEEVPDQPGLHIVDWERVRGPKLVT